MLYTARYAHLSEQPNYGIGDTIYKNQKIGRMGASGSSSANHLHFDLIQGIDLSVYRLKDIPSLIYDHGLLMQQYKHFIDEKMFKHDIHITTSFGDPSYPYDKCESANEWVYHPAFDLVPKDRHETDDHFDIYWNRTKEGKVLSIGTDAGYGNYICVCFEA